MNGEGIGFRWREMIKELTRKKKEKMKGRWMGWIGVLVAAERDWWLTQACKELRAAETD